MKNELLGKQLVRKPAIIDAEEAVSLIQDGSVVLTCGFTLLGVAEEIYRAIEKRFLERETPRQLTLIHAAGQSYKGDGIDCLAHEGLIKRIIGSHWGLCPGLERLIQEDKVEAFCLPMGQLIHLIKAIAGNRPGILSKVGMGTFVDPRLEGGKLNQSAQKSGEDFIQIVTINDEEYLFYRAMKFDFLIARGTTADENGNITMEDEAAKLSVLSAVQAVKRCGGKVIVQVKHLAKAGSLSPKEVVIPGIFVDAIVVAKEPEKYHRQTYSAFFDPVYTGRVKVPVEEGKQLAVSEKFIIGKRAIREIQPGDVVNLGVGIPGDAVGGLIEMEGLSHSVHLTVESGIVGGIPLGEGDFGAAKNPIAIIEQADIFDYYNGLGVDVAFMGAAEIDIHGNVNVSKFGNRTVGCGGFIDITQSAKKVVFCFTFTAGGLAVAIKDGKLVILREGKFKKFVSQVGQVTFSSSFAKSHRQTVLYITERAVFRLVEKGLELIEIAPGIDLERDVLAHMDFKPIISPALREMEFQDLSLAMSLQS